MGYSGHHRTTNYEFQSASYVQQYLKRCYSNSEIPDAERKSYDACYRFIYFIEYGERYYRHAATAEVELKPILLFYGMIQLLKACLLTLDPNYPGDTHVLAHGVTSRKRKKRHYSFMQDEVKGQKNGLFEYFSRKMFHMKQVEGEKYRMEDVLSLIPEMGTLFERITNKTVCYRAIPLTSTSFAIQSDILDSLNMTTERFESFLKQHGKGEINVYKQSRDLLTLRIEEGFRNNLYKRPFLSTLEDLYLPAERTQYNPITEIMAHYLILYNLSMICRYETEWWGDLFHTQESVDLPFILRFLEVTSGKVPRLLYDFLEMRK
ncbi:YaaC family protein [Guptibacillus hwajinpoensis]|uniref:YaaC-like Protein n=1 Tax=Guptibacillus hwajinpoensis TaxID=208199 RepID=A0A0J6CX60_9BACL|nr:YaaC family protein [Alkalihalobacillus macyae]KMM37775.1 hypothetical protein AB986_10455 [Alkalihalobacillus macyae]